MSLPATEPDAPATSRPPRILMALLWALAVAACAAGTWAIALSAGWFCLDAHFSPNQFGGAAVTVTIYATLGGVYGLLAGAVIGFVSGKANRFDRAFGLGSFGMFFGALGG